MQKKKKKTMFYNDIGTLFPESSDLPVEVFGSEHIALYPSSPQYEQV